MAKVSGTPQRRSRFLKSGQGRRQSLGVGQEIRRLLGRPLSGRIYCSPLRRIPLALARLDGISRLGLHVDSTSRSEGNLLSWLAGLRFSSGGTRVGERVSAVRRAGVVRRGCGGVAGGTAPDCVVPLQQQGEIAEGGNCRAGWAGGA